MDAPMVSTEYVEQRWFELQYRGESSGAMLVTEKSCIHIKKTWFTSAWGLEKGLAWAWELTPSPWESAVLNFSSIYHVVSSLFYKECT